MSVPIVQVLQGDCLDILRQYPDGQFDLIITSPPYADSRHKTYGGIHPDHYVKWFLPRAQELLRVLKPSGSFVINIKEKVVDGERHTYVLDLIIALRKLGWLWTEEYIWHKKNCYPGKWPNRFRDAWERCLHFTRSRKFKMNQQSVMVPMGDWAGSRLKALGSNDVVRFDSQVGSGFGKNIANWLNRSMAYPTNVLHMATECGNRNHSAAFPAAIPEWFIKLFTDEGDWVLDPFMGSGTTLEIAQKMGRNSVGIDLLNEYCQLAKNRVVGPQLQLLEDRGIYAENTSKADRQLHREEYSGVSRKKARKPVGVKAGSGIGKKKSIPVQGKKHRNRRAISKTIA